MTTLIVIREPSSRTDGSGCRDPHPSTGLNSESLPEEREEELFKAWGQDHDQGIHRGRPEHVGAHGPI